MSQNETEEEEVYVDVATDTEDDQEDNTASDEITYEQAMKWKKDAESLQKANKKIATLEKATKKAPETISPDLSEDALDAILEKRDFYKSNAQAKELKEEIEAMVIASKWKVDREKAFQMLSWDSEVEENRKTYASPIVSGNKTSTTWFSPITTDKYDRLSDADREAYDAKSLKAKWFIDLK